MNIFLVIPAYNEQDSLQALVPLLVKLPYSLLVVNDCSCDSTLEILSSYPEIKIISNERNLGYSQSLNIGIQKAFQSGASHVITLDSDGQHPLAILPDIAQRLATGSNCVLTIRSGPKPRLSEQLLGFLAQVFSFDILRNEKFSRSFWPSPPTHTPCMEYPSFVFWPSSYRAPVLKPRFFRISATF